MEFPLSRNNTKCVKNANGVSGEVNMANLWTKLEGTIRKCIEI